MAPQRCPHPTSRTGDYDICEYDTLPTKRELAGVIKLRTLLYPGLSIHGAQCNYKGSQKREVGRSAYERREMEAEVRQEGRCYSTGCEAGGRDQEPKTGKGKKNEFCADTLRSTAALWTHFRLLTSRIVKQ